MRLGILFAILANVITIYSVEGKNEQYMGLMTEEQQEQLHSIKNDLIDFLRKPSFKYNITGRAMVPPSLINWFEQKLTELNIYKDIYVDDVYKYLTIKDESSAKILRNNGGFNIYEYNRYDELIDYIRSLEVTYQNSSDVTFDVVEADRTSEGRPLTYVRLTSSTVIPNQKPVIVIEAGVNPREWITVPSSINIIDKLLNSSYNSHLNTFEWIIIPVLNPDGYEYTHTNLRLWTKSRSTTSHLGTICPGVNINRNFDIAWLLEDSSSSPCSHLYGGTEAFSETESRLVRSLLELYGSRLRMYISLQNNGGFIAYPWQFERAASGMFLQHHLIGLDMVAAMGGQYYLDIASTASGDRASGTSTDFMRVNGVPYTFNIDIAPSDEDGVIIAREEIPEIAENVWKAVLAAVNRLP